VPQWSPEERALAARAWAVPQQHVWLLSSAEAAGHLPALCPGADWSRARALASHPRIAEAARRLGFGEVVEAAPTLASIGAALRALGADS
jgi:uroporphyrinogen-III synthase